MTINIINHSILKKTENQLKYTPRHLINNQQKIIEIFNDIAPTYNISNRIISLGLDKKWRRDICKLALECVESSSTLEIADIACGTGDMLYFWQQALASRKISANIIGIDPSANMLKIAHQDYPNITTVHSGVDSLPLENESVDIVSIAFGLRNMVEQQDALAECHRVLKKGGLFVCLEFLRDDSEHLMHRAKNYYINQILPIIGGLIAKNRPAYEYLAQSVQNFSSEKELLGSLKDSHFEVLYAESTWLDVSHKIIARKST